jgi:hypothetical protein
MSTKQRPLVDSAVYDLAERFLSDYRTATAEDETYSLAGEIQNAIEDWIEDALLQGRIKDNRY